MSTGTRVDNSTYPATTPTYGGVFQPSTNEWCFTRSDGTMLLVYLSQGSLQPEWATRSTAGIWTSRGAVVSGYTTVYKVAATQNGDVVTVAVYGVGGGGTTIAEQPINLNNSLGTSHSTTVTATPTSFDVAIWVYSGPTYAPVGVYAVSGSAQVTALALSPNGAPTGTIPVAPATVTACHLLNAGTTTSYATYTTGAASGFRLCPAGLSWGTAEQPTATAVVDWECVFDANGAIDIVYRDTSGNLATLKRSAANTYTGSTTLDTGITSHSCSYNPSTGDLWVYYAKSSHIYLIQRTGGVWGSAIAIANATATFSDPTACTRFSNTNSASDVFFYDTTATAGLYTVRTIAASAPYTPTLTAPSGTVTGLTPQFSFTYGNVNPSDTQGAYEIIVRRSSDNTLFEDTGTVSSAANSGITYSGTALVYGTSYYGQVRVQDSLSSQWSAYSAAVTFTPQQGPVLTMTSLQSTPGGTLQSTATPVYDATTQSMIIHVHVTNASGAHITSYSYQLLASDGATVLQSFGPYTGNITPPSDIGGTLALSSMVAGNDYYILVTVTDTNSLSGSTPITLGQWEIYAAPTPAASPTGFTATPDPTEGVVDLAWTNPINTVSATVFRRPTGTTTWTTLTSGTLRANGTDFPALTTAFDYGVQITDNNGNISAIVTDLNNTLGLLNNQYGVWLNDTSNPAVNSAALGLTYDWQSGTLLDLVTNSRAVVPAGRALPIVAQDLTAYYTAVGRKYIVPDLDGIQVGSTIVAMLDSFSRPPFTPLLYRDPRGKVFICRLATFHQELNDMGLTLVQFDLTQIDNTTPVFV